ncbi:MAG: hypothetical protein ACRC35_14360 [Angustibacter sp.]
MIPRSLLAACVATLAVGGCGLFSPATSNIDGIYGDGVPLEAGQVEARGLVIVGVRARPGLLSGAIANNGSAEQTVRIGVEGQPLPTEITIGPNALVTLGGADADVSVPVARLDRAPGATLRVTLASPQEGQVSAAVPIYPPIREYATVTPGPVPSPSGGTGSTSPTPSSPAPTPTPTATAG